MDIKRALYWLLGLSLICSISSLLLPIWGLKQTSSLVNAQYSFFSFGGYVSYGLGSGSPTTTFTSLSGLPSSFPTVLSVFIITTLAIVIPLAIELTKLRPKSPEAIKSKISPLLLVAGLMSLVSPLAFALLIPGAATTSSSFAIGFWGSASFWGVSATYGPNIGWFLQLASLFLIVCSIIVIYRSRNPNVTRLEIKVKRRTILLLAVLVLVVSAIIVAGVAVIPTLTELSEPPPPPETPGAPSGVHASYYKGVVTVIWSAPSDDGGSSIIGYKIFRSQSSSFSSSPLAEVTSRQYEDNLAGLEGTYYYMVKAYNEVGDSSNSDSMKLVTPTTPHITAVYAKQGMGHYHWYLSPPSGVLSSDITVIFAPSIAGQPTYSFGTYLEYKDMIDVNGATYGTTYTLMLLYEPTNKVCYTDTFKAT